MSIPRTRSTLLRADSAPQPRRKAEDRRQNHWRQNHRAPDSFLPYDSADSDSALILASRAAGACLLGQTQLTHDPGLAQRHVISVRRRSPSRPPLWGRRVVRVVRTVGRGVVRVVWMVRTVGRRVVRVVEMVRTVGRRVVRMVEMVETVETGAAIAEEEQGRSAGSEARVVSTGAFRIRAVDQVGFSGMSHLREGTLAFPVSACVRIQPWAMGEGRQGRGRRPSGRGRACSPADGRGSGRAVGGRAGGRRSRRRRSPRR